MVEIFLKSPNVDVIITLNCVLFFYCLFISFCPLGMFQSMQNGNLQSRMHRRLTHCWISWEEIYILKIEEMANVFLNVANFATHAPLSLALPSGCAMLWMIKVSKVSWTSQLLYEILRSSFDKLHFSEKNTSQKPESWS